MAKSSVLPNAAEAKKARLFSRRHESSAAHIAAQKLYDETQSLRVRRQRAADRDALSSAQTPQERLTELDRRLGAGIGAKKERARLQAKVA